MFRQVPVLPVVVPLSGAALVILVWRLHRRGALTAPRAAVAVAACVYAAGVVANTVFPIYLDRPARTTGWHDALHLGLLSDYETADAVMNIGVFLPVGVLVALVAPRLSRWQVLVGASAVSLAIETSQYVAARVLAGGHVADVNDLLCNVIGAALGLGALTLVQRASVGARMVDRFSWG